MFVKELLEDKRYMRFGVILMLSAAVCAVGSMFGLIGLDTDFSECENAKKIELLEKYNCKYGYATFWNANALTVLTGEKIKVRSIKISDGKAERYNYQSQKSWFAEQKGINEYFVLLSSDEYDDIESGDPDFIESAKDIYDEGDYYILKFDENIF